MPPKLPPKEVKARLKKIHEWHDLGVTREKMAEHLGIGAPGLRQFMREHCPELLNENMRRYVEKTS